MKNGITNVCVNAHEIREWKRKKTRLEISNQMKLKHYT